MASSPSREDLPLLWVAKKHESGLLLLGAGHQEQRTPYSKEPHFPHPHGGVSSLVQ